MKKLISCLLVVMMLLSCTSAIAFAETLEFAETENVVRQFLDETDLELDDLLVELQSGDKVSDLVIRVDKDTLHLVSRNNGVEESHVQINPIAIYVKSGDGVTMLTLATAIKVMQDIVKTTDSLMEQAIQSIPEAEQARMKAEVKKAFDQLAILSYAAAAQEQTDAATLTSAAMEFANKFKPEYILDVKQDGGNVEINLRSEAFATALAEAVDSLMTNPALAELVDRDAAVNGGQTFAEYQKEWLANREDILASVRTIESTESMSEYGHYKSHFKMGEEFSAMKILLCETDAWIDAEAGKAEGTVAMGFENEDPFLVYEFEEKPSYYWERTTSGNSKSEIYYEIEDNKITSGKLVTVVEGVEAMRTEFGPDYVNLKGLTGGISSTVRETWTGKTRYQLIAENANGDEATITFDFYQDGDSLVCEMYTDQSDETVVYTISRIDKEDMEDLTASKNINEITVEKINAELEGLLKLVSPALAAAK